MHPARVADFLGRSDAAYRRPLAIGGLLMAATVCAYAVMPSAGPTDAAALSPMAGRTCAEQTWPYLDGQCLGQRSVRVLPTATADTTTVMVLPIPDPIPVAQPPKMPTASATSARADAGQHHKRKIRPNPRRDYAQSLDRRQTDGSPYGQTDGSPYGRQSSSRW